MTSAAAGFVERLDAVTERLHVLASRENPAGALTEPDPPTGERWEAGQVWAHMAEFVPYWTAEMAQVVDRGMTAPDPFGRTKADPTRIAAIERDRHHNRGALWRRLAGDIARLRAYLLGLDAEAWTARGQHSTFGTIELPGIVDEFLVGHLEQHAAQLEALVR
jgi:hypothetical protein